MCNMLHSKLIMKMLPFYTNFRNKILYFVARSQQACLVQLKLEAFVIILHTFFQYFWTTQFIHVIQLASRKKERKKDRIFHRMSWVFLKKKAEISGQYLANIPKDIWFFPVLEWWFYVSLKEIIVFFNPLRESFYA